MVLAKTRKFWGTLGSRTDMYDNGVQSRSQRQGKMMTDATARYPHTGDNERLDALLRADAAAIIDDDIDDEQDGLSAQDEPPRASRRPRSQVYSIRVPVERLEQVRAIAKERGIAPTAMLRDWVLQQLDAEVAKASSKDHAAERPSKDGQHSEERLEAVCAQLEAMTQTMLSTVTQLATTLAKSADLLALSRQPEAVQHGHRTLRSHQEDLLPEAHPAFMVHYAVPSIFPAASAWQLFQEHHLLTTQDQVNRGVAALHATVESITTWPSSHGIADLDSLYIAADEELSKP